MGWTYTHLDKGQALNYFKELCTYQRENFKSEFIQGAFTSFRRFYAAVRHTHVDTGKTEVWCFVAMVDWQRHDHHNFGYKDMCDTMGPNIADCPESILKLLSPTEQITDSRDKDGSYAWAKNWRIRCWESVLSKKQTKKIKDGDTIKLEFPLSFRNGEKRDTFYVKKIGKRLKFMSDKNGYTSYQVRRDAIGNAKVLQTA